MVLGATIEGNVFVYLSDEAAAEAAGKAETVLIREIGDEAAAAAAGENWCSLMPF